VPSTDEEGQALPLCKSACVFVKAISTTLVRSYWIINVQSEHQKDLTVIMSWSKINCSGFQGNI